MGFLADCLGSRRFKKEVAQWFRDRGDETLRIEYPLSDSALVLDVGGFRGDFAEAIHQRYGCHVHVFEPVAEYCAQLRERFGRNPKVVIHEFGLGAKSRHVELSLMNDGTSHIHRGLGGATTGGRVIAFDEFALSEEIERVDLMKVNIEGAEFELLEHILDSGWVNKIENIQVQFHLFVDDAQDRRAMIRRRLAATHELTYDYYFVWENWRRKKGSGDA